MNSNLLQTLTSQVAQTGHWCPTLGLINISKLLIFLCLENPNLFIVVTLKCSANCLTF